MKASVGTIDWQLSDDMSKDCRFKKTSVFEVDKEDSVES